ncbi:MAG: type II secretion system F family protein [Candidatus Saccharibacteria bacterium]|nr:type II secretion system F family protein [Candidatus Saccharibacteria bacterium]
MAKFTFTALKPTGETLSGNLEATNRAAAINLIKGQDLKLIDLKEDTGGKSSLSFRRKKSVSSDELVAFTRQLSAMVSAGVPILRSLTSMAEHAESPHFKAVLNGVSKEIEGGTSFADALAKYPEAFSDVYINMVRAGEAGGVLDDILKRLALQQEKNASIKKKVKGAMTYPMVLVFITIGAFFGLMLFVIPAIGKTIKDLGGEDAELPVITEIMLGISHFFVNFWFIVFPVIGAGIWSLLRYIKSPTGKKKFHRFILKAPIISKIIKKVAVARFTRTFSALIGAGVSVLEALEVTARAIGNTVYEESLLDAANRIKNGEVLSKIINENPDLYPPIVGQMLAVGEETGQTDMVLVKVADFYEEEVDTAIAGISSVIEPVMIVFMGGMVGLIAASVMMPITGLANQIKH